MRLVPGQLVSIAAAALGTDQVHQCAALIVLPFAEIERARIGARRRQASRWSGEAAQRCEREMAQQLGADLVDGALRSEPARADSPALSATPTRPAETAARDGRLGEEQVPLREPAQPCSSGAMARIPLCTRELVAGKPRSGRIARLKAELGVEPPGAGFERFVVAELIRSRLNKVVPNTCRNWPTSANVEALRHREGVEGVERSAALQPTISAWW